MFAKRLALTWMLPLLAAAAFAQPPQTRWRVTPTGSGDGSSWPNACSLQYALEHATPNQNPPYDIWVAQGTYNPSVIYPPDGTDPRQKTFHMPLGVKVYGGFVGTEGNDDLALRNPEANETILDGNIDTGGNNDCYHVVYFDAATVTTTKLSGFTIRNGRATHASDADDSYGGGIFMKRDDADGGPALDRLKIRDNFARLGGAGLYDRHMGYTHVANCRFEHNEVTQSTDGKGDILIYWGCWFVIAGAQ